MNISKETYEEMKRLVEQYENQSISSQEEKPYIETAKIKIHRQYNPNYGDHRECECGHPYYRHFDTYEDMYPCGCKYCQCYTFKEKILTTN